MEGEWGGSRERDQSISCRSLTRPPNRDDLANSLIPLSPAGMDSCSSENDENRQKSALFARREHSQSHLPIATKFAGSITRNIGREESNQ
ncbi:hypothetical protein TNCT_188361 [Trichonephila clavata]|uniref:Uncharacterized protein n=1 Tax=Trichonephila clavata TaxID=2740835 RepID=A0A8X6HQ01_TRICU|nr:hypothetical protein TNCT_188361 [Trichonephila clavata]